MGNKTITRGQLAKSTGIGIETVRFYEQKGLLEAPKRSSSGYRQYPTEAIDRVNFITRAKNLGFSLNEILELLSLKVSKKSKCRDIKQVAANKVDEIDSKISDLKKIKKALGKLIKICQENKPTSECPILDALNI